MCLVLLHEISDHCVQCCEPVMIVCVLWETGPYLTGTNILVSARDLAREQRKSFPHQESSWRVLGLVFFGHTREHRPPFLTSPHLCGLTPWTTTSFLYSVPCIVLSGVSLIYYFRLFLFPIPKLLVFPRVSSSNFFPYSMKSLWDFPSTSIASIAPYKETTHLPPKLKFS